MKFFYLKIRTISLCALLDILKEKLSSYQKKSIDEDWIQLTLTVSPKINPPLASALPFTITSQNPLHSFSAKFLLPEMGAFVNRLCGV